jgi:hypothetical protein
VLTIYVIDYTVTNILAQFVVPVIAKLKNATNLKNKFTFPIFPSDHKCASMVINFGDLDSTTQICDKFITK